MAIRKMIKPTRAILTAIGLSLVTLPVFAATVTVLNMDGPTEGFNDPTVVPPVAGNPATTRGEQRLNAAQAAANAWGSVLTSSVPITVEMNFDPQFCDAFSAVLGSAGPTTVHADFTGAPLTNTWYPQALANALSGADRDVTQSDIVATFNSDIDDNNACLNGINWWYGIGAPAIPGTIDFFGVLLHEMGHGLGFLTVVDIGTGAQLQGLPDTYEVNLEDHSLGMNWPAMTDEQRQASAIDTSDLHWTGPSVVGNSGVLTAGVGASNHVQMYAPNPVEFGSSVSHWDTAVTPNELMEPFATPDLADLVTYNLFRDIGWTISGSVTDVVPVSPPASGKNDITVTNGFINLDVTGGGQPDDAECDAANEYGRMILDETSGALWLCYQSGWISK